MRAAVGVHAGWGRRRRMVNCIVSMGNYFAQEGSY